MKQVLTWCSHFKAGQPFQRTPCFRCRKSVNIAPRKVQIRWHIRAGERGFASYTLLSRLSVSTNFASMWCNTILAPSLPGSCVETICCTWYPNVDLSSLKLNPSPVKHSTWSSIASVASTSEAMPHKTIRAFFHCKFIAQGAQLWP